MKFAFVSSIPRTKIINLSLSHGHARAYCLITRNHGFGFHEKHRARTSKLARSILNSKLIRENLEQKGYSLFIKKKTIFKYNSSPERLSLKRVLDYIARRGKVKILRNVIEVITTG